MNSLSSSTSRADKVAARRLALLDVAWQVIAVEGERVSMDRIATAAGITRPVLYRHFGDIGGLYLAVADRFATQLYSSLERLQRTENGRPLLRATVDAYIRTIEANPQIYRYLTRRSGSDLDDSGATVRDFTRQLGESVTDFLAVTGLHPTIAALRGHALVGAIQATGDWWLDNASIPRKQLVDQLTQVLWSGHSSTPS